ncbi:MAG: SpaA isopeptide-forming pilin-related protein, partial [Anaerococcus sp.]|nr:SpaA isopeptide-forming pilin-related protein [Anaerococcus sp.]
NKAKKLLEASYDNGDWNKTKADSVELVFYKHNNKKTIQNLITAKIRKPINAQKISLDDTKLDGAEFTFTSRQTGESVTWTSKENNDDNPLFLKPGQYYVDETKAPKGYSELDTFLIELEEKEVNPDHGPYPQYGLGDIKVNDSYEYKLSMLNPKTLKKDDNAVQKDGSGNPLVTVDKDTLNLNIKNEDSNLGKIEFTKTNGRRAIDGAEFTLTKITDENKLDSIEKKDEKPVYQKTSTGTNGKFTFGSIPEGTYKLEETKAPTGYQAIEPLILTATKNQDEKVTVKFKDETIQKSGEIINKAPSTELSFRKIKKTEEGKKIVPIDSGTGSFRLYSTNTVDDSSYDRTVSPSSTVVEKDEEKGTPGLQVGEFKFTDLVAGEYILVEEQAPIGFEKPDFPFWSVKVTEKDGELSYEVSKLNKDTDSTPINESDIIDNENKVVGKTFNIENKARTIDHKFKKYLDKKGNKMNAYLRGEDGEPVSFRLYEADYYGLKKDPNDPGKRIVADEDGYFNLKGLEYSTYYLLEEENPPKGYAKAAATVLYVQSEAEVQTGKMAVVVRDHTNNTVTGEHNVFDGIVDYKAGEAFGNLLVKKTGESLKEGDDREVGLRRAYFRLYYADKEFNYDDSDYIQRVSAGSALTDNEGNPIDIDKLPSDQGIVKFENLKPGNYVLIEHRGPAGYEKDTNPRYIKVTESGNVIKSMDKDNAIFKEEDIKEETLIDTGNTSFFSRNKSDYDQSNGLMISELPKRLAAQRASSTDGSWENINEFKSEKPYRNQDPMGTDLNQTKITQIDKKNKRFRQVFLLKNPKEQTLIANLHWQPLKQIKPNDFNIKVSYVDSDSTFDNLKNPQKISLRAPRNLDNKHIRLESTKKIPDNATVAIELETSYTPSDRIGLGVDFFYEHDTADQRGWKKAWATEMYETDAGINTQSNKRTEY